MISRQELKAKAKEVAFKNKWNVFKPTLVLFAISFGVGVIMGVINNETINAIGPLVLSFAMAFFQVGYMKYLLNISRGEEATMDTIWDFKKVALNAFIMLFLMQLFVFGWSLLLIIPGIIAAFSYSQCFFVMADNMDIEPLEAISESKRLMQGHKMEFFVLQLSFIGWQILGSITFGIAYIWALPYMSITTAMYFDELKKAA